MISTDKTISGMPLKLAAFRKYIEAYECTYSNDNNVHTVIFYTDKKGIPYIFLKAKDNDNHVEIYVNYMRDTQPCSILNHCDNISYDMNLFIAAIKECKKG